MTRRLGIAFAVLVGIFVAAQLLMAAGAVVARLAALAVLAAAAGFLWIRERDASR